MSVSILSKAGIKTNFDSDKVLLSKWGGFVGKGFYSNGLFVLDVSKVMNDKCLICVEAKSTKKSCKPRVSWNRTFRFNSFSYRWLSL